jgi:hypothetical protein
MLKPHNPHQEEYRAMPDESVDDIIEENHQRKVDEHAREDKEDGILGVFDRAIDPIVENFERNTSDDPDEEGKAARRELNDEAQRPE